MGFWKRITGGDITKQLKSLEPRINRLPADYQAAWRDINIHLWQRSDFSGPDLLPILNRILDLLERMAAKGLSAREVLQDGVQKFCDELTNEETEDLQRRISISAVSFK